MNQHVGVAELFQTPVVLKAPKRQEKPLELLHIGSHIRLARYLRKLIPQAAGERMGVKAGSVLQWERGESSPDFKTVPAVLRFLGYDPYPPPQTTLEERLFALRRAWGWTHEEAAKTFGVAAKTWWTWETGEHAPLPLYAKLLDAFLKERHAEAVKGWADTPPSGDTLAPACFKIVAGRVVNTEGTMTAARIRWERERARKKPEPDSGPDL